MFWLRIFTLAVICLAILSGQTESTGSHIGVLLRDVTAERAQQLKLDNQQGAEVVAVQNGSPAAEAGIQAGDVLLMYNGEKVVGRQQLGRLVAETPVGRRVGLRLWRNGRTFTAWVVTAVMAQEPEAVLPDFPMAPDIPGTVMVWRNRILGTICETLPPEMSTFFGVAHGVLVRFVDKGALGDLSGLKPGDVIQAASDRPILNPRDITGALLADGGTIRHARLVVWRDHKRIIIDIHPTE